MSRAAWLGAFIVGTLAILIAGIFIIGGRQYLFTSTYQLKTHFNNVAGLDAGADVRVGGVHSGTVRKIVLPHRPGESVTVVMDLDKTTHEIVKRDSVASIETEGLVGSQYMAISFGSAGKGDVRDGDSIASIAPLEVSALLSKASEILDSSQEAIQNTTRATASIASVSAKIDAGQGTVGALVNDKEIYDSLRQTAAVLHTTVGHADTGVTAFQEDMEALKHNFLLRGFFKNRGYQDSAEVARNEVEDLPPGTPAKEFTYQVKQLFGKHDTAELKNQKSLNNGGEYLANNPFGLAVVVSSAGMGGDSQEDLQLTAARAMVVRDYLVDTFEFDDSHLVTLGLGKQKEAVSEAGWGTVRILIYQVGTAVPARKQTPAAASSRTAPDTPVQASTSAAKR